MYESLYQSVFGGIGLVVRVPRTAAALDDWVAKTSARYGSPVTVNAAIYANPNASQFVWLLQDPLPLNPTSMSLVGYSTSPQPLFQAYGINDTVQELLASLNDTVPDVPIPMFGHHVSVTGLLPFEIASNLLGFEMFTPILFDAHGPTALVATVTVFNVFFESVLNTSADATVVITDHYGRTTGVGSCTVADADQVLEAETLVTPTARWKIQIGQCPAYAKSFITFKRHLLLAISLVITALALAVTLLVFDRFDSQRRQTEEKSRAHQLIVGYICHELRNPLHIIRTAQATLVGWVLQHGGAAIKQYLPRGSHHSASCSEDGETDTLSNEDLAGVIVDATSALAAMQSTVNEVLDFRALESGINSLKLNPRHIVIAPVCVGVGVCV